MRSKIPAFIALFCILVYVGAVLSAAYRVYASVEGQRRRAGEELAELEALIVRSGDEFFTDPWRERVRAALGECAALEGIIITGSQGDLGFEKEAGNLIRWDGPVPRFTLPRFGYAALRARQADIPGFRNVNIYPAINVINYEYVAYVLRQSLLAILGALALSFLTMITGALRSRAGSGPGAEDAAGAGGVSPGEPGETFGDEDGGDDDGGGAGAEPDEPDLGDEPDDGFDDDFFDDFSPPSGDPSAPDGGLSGDDGDFELPDFDDDGTGAEAEGGGTPNDDDDFDLGDFLDEDDLSPPGGDARPGAASVPPGNAGGAGPSGLYSPRSGIGWEAYTEDRLASELHRCAASEQDLVVFLMQCGDGVNCDGALYRKIAAAAVDLFNLRDLTFEYGGRGITVIFPNADLEQGIIKAEEYHGRILKTCFDAFHSRNDFLVGLSSRSGRLIEADRLLLEASRALDKAKTDGGSPIVAFKSDPEKYRNFVRQGRRD